MGYAGSLLVRSRLNESVFIMGWDAFGHDEKGNWAAHMDTRQHTSELTVAHKQQADHGRMGKDND